MASTGQKTLTARVKVDSSQAEKKLSRLATMLRDINKVTSTNTKVSKMETAINKQVVAAEKLKQVTAKAKAEEEKLAQSKMRTKMITNQNLLAEEKLNQARMRSQQMIDNQNAKQEAAAQKELARIAKIEAAEQAALQKQLNDVDKLIAKELEAVHKKQVANNKKFLAEEAAYQKEQKQLEAIKRKELEREAIRQRSLTTMTAADRAAQRMVRSAEELSRVEYENWWRASLTKQEWEKAHPILTKLGNKISQIEQKYQRLSGIGNRFNTMLTTNSTRAGRVRDTISQWAAKLRNATSANKSFNSSLSATKNAVASINNKLSGLAATYLGVMTGRAVVDTTDAYTSAENRLNYINSQNMGLPANSEAVVNTSQADMDKMYESAQKVRMSYTDMMQNVSKQMTLAGDAFQNNVDNAIRFQEIMAESYTLGGASAAEMSSSMYQLSQALGSGILQGDELRSVREGAPLAYKAIEEFAQGVYNTETSLKDLASQGMITSDLVVAAVMDMGSEIDAAFAQTQFLFTQAWEMMKNTAKKAFEPVGKMLRSMLTDAMNAGLLDKLEVAFNNIAKALIIVLQVVKNVVTWIADNWSWLEGVVVAGLTTIGIMMIGTAIASAARWIWASRSLIPMVVIIFTIIYLLYQWVNGVIETTQIMQYAYIALCAIILLVVAKITLGWLVGMGIMTAGTAWAILAIIAIVMVALYLILSGFDKVCGYAAMAVAFLFNIASYITSFIFACIFTILAVFQNAIAFVVNLFMAAANAVGTIIQWIIAFIVNVVMACAQFIMAVSHNAVAFIINLGAALFNSMSAFATNIGIAFQNAWNGALSSFWNFIADCVDGLDWLSKPLEAIAKLFGKSFDAGSFSKGLRKKASAYKQQDYVSMTSAFSSGMNTVAYKDISASISKGWNTMDYADMGSMVSKGWNTMDYASFGDAWSKGWNMSERVDLSDAYNKGAAWGAAKSDSFVGMIDGLKNSLKNKLDTNSNLDKIGEKLGLDLAELTGTKGGSASPSGGAGRYSPTGGAGSYDPAKVLDGINKAGGKTADNTGKIADSMDLTQEDLEYLRKVADMEWKKEFTTASIKIDMSNYNTINGDSDLDGIVTKLADKLYEELDVVANGVYS